MVEVGSYYKTNEKGQYVQVNDIETVCDNIKILYNDLKNENKELKRLNSILKDEHYKNYELAEMQQALRVMEDNYSRGFPMFKDEEGAIQEWKNQHEAKIHAPKDKVIGVGGRYTYEFIPTAIGTIGTIKCSCGEEFEFRSL